MRSVYNATLLLTMLNAFNFMDFFVVLLNNFSFSKLDKLTFSLSMLKKAAVVYSYISLANSPAWTVPTIPPLCHFIQACQSSQWLLWTGQTFMDNYILCGLLELLLEYRLERWRGLRTRKDIYRSTACSSPGHYHQGMHHKQLEH